MYSSILAIYPQWLPLPASRDLLYYTPYANNDQLGLVVGQGYRI